MSNAIKRIAAAFAVCLFAAPLAHAQTTDWTQQFGTGTDDEVWGIASDGNFLYLTGYVTGVTAPGGNEYTWNQIATGFAENLLAVDMLDASNAVAVGAQGRIAASIDGGNTWSPLVSPTVEDLHDVHFFDANIGLAVGNAGTILRTINGGNVWTLQPSGTGLALYGVRWLSATDAVAVGAAGRALRSTDGGDTWAQQLAPPFDDLNAVSFANATDGVAVGNNGTILVTNTGGVIWTTLVSPTISNLFGAYMADASNFWACGDSATIIGTTDGGQTWNGRVAWFGDTITSVYFADVNHGVIASAGGRLMRTNDGGANWFNQQLYPTSLRAMSFFDTDQGIVVGDSGAVYQSIPQGPGQGWDLVLQKRDLDGNLIWTRQIGTAAQDFGHCVSTDGSVVFIGGETGGAMPGQVAGGNQDAVLACFTTNGILMWLTQFGNSGSEWIDGVAVYGDVYVTGIDNGSDVMVRRYSSSGPLLWNKPFGSTGIDIGQGITLGSPTEIYLVGLTLGTLPGQTSAGGQDMFIRRIDPAGNEIWTLQTGTANDDYFDSVYADANGVYASGIQNNGSGISDAIIARYDTGGAFQWSDVVSTAGFDRGWSISGDASSVTLAGVAGGALPGQTFAGGNDAFLRRYSPAGSVLWTTQFGTNADDEIKGVVRVGGADYVGGYTDAALAGQTSVGGRDAFAMKVVADAIPGRIYVDAAATGANSGASWTDAFADLQDALAIAVSGDSLWVAAGTYYPSSTGDRGATFQMMNGVVMYGGFTGVETSLSQRAPFANQTTLSGDIGVPLNSSDNSYHVVTAGGAIDATAILDGFYIRDGQADAPALDSNGGGLFNPGTGSPAIFNCTFESNFAIARGGGVYTEDGNPFFSTVWFNGNNSVEQGGGVAVVGGSGLYANVVFDGNVAGSGGGGMVAIGSPTFSGAVFTNNQAPSGAGLQSWQAVELGLARFQNNTGTDGGGLMVAAGTATVYSSLFAGNNVNNAGGGILLGLNVTASLTNVTVAGNSAGLEGGGVRVDGNVNCAIANAIITDNLAVTGPQILSSGAVTVSHSLIAGSGGSGPSWDGTLGADLGGNLDDDPRFVNLLGGDLHLLAASPAIDAGDSSAVNAALDLDAYPRVAGTRVDMGAYEFRGACPPGNVLYVNVAAVGGDGSSWAQALTDLPGALAVAAGCSTVTEIWVASGTYRPTGSSDRIATFELRNNLAIYGGFAGVETDLSQRDVNLNYCELSGDIGTPGVSTDNSYHILTGGNGIDASAVIDGFTIRDGYNVDISSLGAGMYLTGASPTIRNCSFYSNDAYIGGAIYMLLSASMVDSCTFGDTAEGDGNTAQAGGAVFCDSSTTTFTNCTFRGNSAPPNNGGAVDNAYGSNVTYVDCVFDQNSALRGGALHVWNSELALTRCTFTNNNASFGGGLHLEVPGTAAAAAPVDESAISLGARTGASPRPARPALPADGTNAPMPGGLADPGRIHVIDCDFDGNTALGDGGGAEFIEGSALVVNSRFFNNTAQGDTLSGGGSPFGGGGIVSFNSVTSVVNCTLARNEALGINLNDGGGGIFGYGGAVNVRNSIVANNSDDVNTDTEAAQFLVPVGTATVDHSLITGLTDALAATGTGNVAGDPAFVNESGGDLHLTLASAAIEGGNNADPDLPAADHDGLPRVSGVNTDMGAYEYPVSCPAQTVIYVDGGRDPGDGLSWTFPFTDLHEALNLARACPTIEEIWVAAYTYPTTNGFNRFATFRLADGVALYGGFAGDETDLSQRDPVANPTILSGEVGTVDSFDNSYHVVTVPATAGASTRFDGFTVQDGFADGGGSINNGAGMDNSGSPAIANVTFFRNHANGIGGGVRNGAASTFTDCVFYQNVALNDGGGLHQGNNDTAIFRNVVFRENSGLFGGGIRTGGPCEFTNVVFVDNAAEGGGGMMNFGDAVLTNTTFFRNSAGGYGGGAMANGDVSTPTIINSIFWANTATSGSPSIGNTVNAIPGISYSLVQGSGGSGVWSDPNIGTDLGNNIDLAPLFVDEPTGDVHLQVTSPGVNAGSNAAPNLLATDLDGAQRIRGGTVDMGAYESLAGADSDGDGIDDQNDLCPFENAANFDRNNDGCIDDGAGGRHVEYWGTADSVLTYVISQNGAPGVSDGSDFTAIQNAFGAWTAIGGTTQQAAYGGTTPQTTANNLDLVNLITFDDNTYNFGSSVLAVGLSTSFTVDSVFVGVEYRAGQIVDADMLFNPAKAFRTPTSGGTGSDIQSVATHEAGHMFGLSHSTIVTSTMFYALPPGTRAAVIEADDALAFLKAYGSSATMSGTNRIEGAVYDGVTGDPIGGAIVFLIDAVTGDSSACDYTLPQTGEFSFVGIPDGDYYVSMHPMDGSSGVSYITPARINWLIASTPQTVFKPEYWDAAESNVEADDNAKTAITVSGGSQVTDVFLYPNIDATPPTVVAVDPANGSAGVPAVGAILILFSEPMNSGTLVGNFALRDSLTQVAVGGNATFLRDDSLISFTPAPLAYNTTYELRLDTGLQDLFGNGLAAPFVSYFHTEAPPGYGVTALVPDKGVPGSVVVVVGNEFTTDTADFTVTFGGVAGTVLQASPTQLVVQVPPGAQSGDAVVDQVGQGPSNPVGFTVLPPLQAARAIPVGVSNLGSLPRAVDVLPSGGHAFVATEQGVSSVVTDAAQGNFLSNVAISIPGGLVDLAVRTDGRRVYGVSFIDHTLSIIDSDFEGASPTVNTVRATLPLSAPPLGISIEPTGRKAYIPTSDGEIQVWDISKSATASQIGVMIASDPNLRGRTAVDPVRNQLLALTGTGKVLFFDLATDTQSGQVSVGGDPRDIFIDPAGERAYVTDNRGFVTIVSLASRLRVTPDMTTGGALRGVTGSPSGQYLFAANRLLNFIEVIDLDVANPTFRTVVNRVPQGINPVDVDVSPDGLYLYSLVEDTRQFVVTAIGEGPAITALSASAAPVGAKIVVAGESLAADSLQTVSFNGIEVVPSALSNSQLTVTVPPGASSGPVQVIARDSGGAVSKSNEVYFEVLGPTTPGGLRLAAKAAPVDGDSTLTPAMAVSPTGNVMVFGSNSGDVWVMDVDPASPTYNQVLDRFQPILSPVDDIAVTPDGRRAMVMSGNALVALDVNPLSPSYGTVVGTVDLSSLGGSTLANILVSPGGHRLLVSNPTLDSVHIINIDPASPQAYQLIGSIPVGNNVFEMAFHPGGRYAYLPLVGPATQTIVIADIDVGLVANTVVLPSPVPAETVMDLDFLPDGNRALMLTSQLSGPANRSVVMINTSNPVNPTLVNRQAFGVALSPTPEKIRVSPRGDRAIFAVRGQLFSHVAIEPDSVLLLEQSGDLFFHLTRVEMDYAPDGSRLYATSSFRDSVLVYDFSAAQTMTIASGSGQTGVINRELGLPLEVLVTDASANAVPGVAVRFTVTAGGGKFVDTGTTTQIAATGIDGVATVRWNLGAVIGPGTQTVSAASAGLANSPLVFTATSVDDPNNLPLQATSILPLAGSSDVSVTTAVSVTFTRSVAVSSVTTATLYLQRVSDAVRVAAVVGYSNDRKQISLTPDGPLAYNTGYALVIGALQDDSGGTITNPGTSTFTTRPGAPPLALTGVSPPSATPQATIVLSGVSFDSIPAGNTVLFNDVAVTPFAAGLDFLNVKVPASAVSGTVSVQVGAATTAGKAFTVLHPMETNIDEVLATIGTAGAAAKSMTINPDGTIAYSVSPEGNVVIPIDVGGLTTFPTIPVGREPVAIDMTPDGLSAFVANLQSGTVSVIDTDPASPTFNQVIETVVVGTAPVDLIVSPDGDRTFVALGVTNEIGVLDSDESSETHLQVLASVPTGGTGTKSLTINPDGTELYVGDATGFVVIDPLTNGVLKSVPTGSATKSMTISPDGTLLFIVTTEGQVLIVDNEVDSPTRDEVIRNIGTSGGTKSLAVNPDGTLLYLIQEESDVVLVLSIEVTSSVSIISDDLPPGKVAVAVVDTIDAGEDPEQLVFSPDGSGRALLTSPGDKTIVVLGTEPLVIAADIEVKPHTLNLKSNGRWISGSIELPSPYLPGDIDIGTVMLQDSLHAHPDKWSVGDDDEDGIPDLNVKFDRAEFQMIMPQGEYVPVTITGMVSGRAFAGEDTIRTIRPTLTRPASFALLAMGESTTIEWASPSGYQVDYVDIFFSVDDGENWEPVAEGIPDTHVIPWQAPLVMSDKCRIMVTLYRDDDDYAQSGGALSGEEHDDEVIGSGMNQYPFTISAPVALTLQRFEARMEDSEAVLHWETSQEVGTQGFNLYRSTDREAGYALVNTELIAAAGRITGGEYQYRDKLAVGNQTYYYRLEEVSGGGEPNVFGPFEVRFRVVFDLAQNVPNPFNPTTTIKYAVPVRSTVNLTIYDVAGRVVTTLVNETREPNAYTVTWDGTNNRGERVASGVYFYRIVAGKYRDTRKMVLLK